MPNLCWAKGNFMNILNLLEQDNILARKKTSTEYCSPCPVCGGNDRFQSFINENRWYCRGCNKSGDLIEYLIYCRGLSYPDACRYLGKEDKLTRKRWLNNVRKSTKREDQSNWMPKPKQSINSAWQNKATDLVQHFHNELLKNSSKLEWLLNERGINIETVKRIKLGWNDKVMFCNRSDWNLPEEYKKDGRIKKLWIPSGLIIPCYNVNNEIVRVKFRLDKPINNNGKPFKYYVLPGSSISLSFYSKKKESVVIVESELDAILISQESKLITAIATGSTKIRPDIDETNYLKAVDEILISFDSDMAGKKDSWDFWLKQFSNATRYPIPEKFGKDPTEAFLQDFPLGLWIQAAFPEKNNKIYTDIEAQQILDNAIKLAGNNKNLVELIDQAILAEESKNNMVFNQLLVKMDSMLKE